MRVNHDGLGDRLAVMLAELYTPQKTKAGGVATEKGVPLYSDSDHSEFCSRFLGGSVSRASLAEVLKGRGCMYVKTLCAKSVDRFMSGEDVVQSVKRDNFRRDARQAIWFYEEFGLCPDGSGEFIFDSLEVLAVKRGAVDVAILDEAAILQDIKRGSDDEY